MKKIVCIDMGNTSVHFGIVQGNMVLNKWRLPTNGLGMSDILVSLQDKHFEGFSVGSVVPNSTDIIRDSVAEFNVPSVFYGDMGISTGIYIPFAHARDVGADIILNGMASHYVYGTNVIIVDFGTATTFDVFSHNKEFCGTVIAPGVELSLTTLYKNAAQLPKVSVVPTQKVVCTTTTECMQSGIFWGYLSLIEGVIKRIKTEYDADTRFGNQPMCVVATGGLASLFSDYTNSIDYIHSDLTLLGLNLLFERNIHELS